MIDEIKDKLILATLENWENNANNIMDSQKKFNEEALAWSKLRFEKWLDEIKTIKG